MPTGGGAPTPRTGLVERRDLLDALDRAVTKAVTIVSAPAGSGKTSALRAWADRPRQRRRIIFMTVRPEQQDAQLFWLALLGVVRSASGGIEPPPPAPGFNGSAMVARVRSELAAPGEPVVLVIDDLHELASTEANEQLATLLTSLPTNVHAIVATRGEPPFRLHQLRLAGQLAEIRPAQLRFTAEETRTLLAANAITLPAPAVATLHERTEGWAAGLRLAVLSLAGRPDPERFVAQFSGTDRTVAEYLLAEMLDRQPPDVRHLLLRTCLLDRFNGELADLLADACGSERTLLDLEEANAFVVSLDPARTWFRYHHLFRDLLRLELRRSAPAEIPTLHRLAARWFGDHGEIADAIRHQQAAGDWTEAADLLADHALSLTLDGKAATVAALLGGFPARTGTDSPGLALVRAVADLGQRHLEQADAQLDAARAYAATVPPDRQNRLNTAIASLNLLTARLRGHFDGVFAQVDALPAPTADSEGFDASLGNDLRALALLNLGVTEAWSLRLADSRRHLTEGATLAGDIGRPYLQVACLAHLGFAAAGDSFVEARQYCHDAIALAAQHGWGTEPVIAPAYATFAGLLISTGDLDRGERWLDRARRATPTAGEPGIQLLIHLLAALPPAARGQYDQALTELRAAAQVQAHMAGRHALTSWVVAWTIATHARLGHLDQARAALAAVDDDLSGTSELRNAAATVRLAARDPAGARRELEPVLAGSAGTTFARIEAALLDALAGRDLGDDRAGAAALERALDLAEPDRLILPFAMTGAWTLFTAAEPPRTAHPAFAAEIVDAFRGSRPSRGTISERVEPLSRTELRVLRYLPTNLTRPEIAEQLSVSVNTVNTHIRRIYRKL
ncbi:MAG TPA: AAA family ATPase, partial [Jatrophihabitantaceae bacterium]|nr:AAA family ATPase [Jatrophihabitantaceae bacterium]